MNAPQKKQSKMRIPNKFRRSGEEVRGGGNFSASGEFTFSKKDRRKTMVPQTSSSPRKQSVTFNEPNRPSTSTSPPAYGEDNQAVLALPTDNRLSESSRSDTSSGDRVYGSSTTTTTHTIHTTTTTFFRLPRRKNKQPEPLFPIHHLPQKAKSSFQADRSASSSSLAVSVPDGAPVANGSSSHSAESQQTPTQSRPSSRGGTVAQGHLPSHFSKTNTSPMTALLRPNSRNSGQSSPTKAHLNIRGRSSTLSSLGRNSPRGSVDGHLAPPASRNSSAIGRKSFGDLLSLSRLKQGSELSGRGGPLTPTTPGSNASKNNSLQIARETTVVLPERREDDTPAKYLARVEEAISRGAIAAAVSKGADTFSQAVLRSYMRRYSFFGDPMDMAIRKLLMEAELPKETQQIDRCLQAFANRYHECNPGIYSSPDQAYFIAFSLLILHTDVFNKNNKHKMQKNDYLKNTKDEGIFNEILEVFYDNITYTPFIRVEDDFDINGDRISTHKSKKKSIFPNTSPDVAAKRATKEPLDPYMLIIDGKLDVLRPNLKDVMHLEDPYGYLGTAKSLDMRELQQTFFKTGILQIVSARSRPDAFMSEKTATNPDEAHPGIVDIKITKVGLLWRKDIKKKKTRSPWQEWGAILTGAQLYFFRNTTWVKSLIHQYETHVKQGHDGIPIIFKPPLEHFKPDALMSTDGAVALVDSTYKKHKHAFTYVRHGGFEEVLLADNDEEMNDWLAKLNYAAAFRTSGVRMRGGVVGGGYDGQGRRALRRLDNEAEGIQTPTGEVTVARSKIDQSLAQDILSARREAIKEKISGAGEKLETAEKHLEYQLRNSRHLQILAPIHPKTREAMLLAAARLAAQLKWSRMEIWRLKCHRDILSLDLEEERQLLGLPASEGTEETCEPLPEKPAMQREVSSSSRTSEPPRSPLLSPAQESSQARTSTDTRESEDNSTAADVFQTPPTSATLPGIEEQHASATDLQVHNDERLCSRKVSVSSAMSNHSIMATPPRITATAPANANASANSPSDNKTPAAPEEEVDANERDLLEQAGLLESENTPRPASASAKHHGPESEAHGDRLDRNKIRRSLQRTLRESAGHLSHHRARKGKEAVSNGGAEEGAHEGSDILSRGSGSFVVHGKKASVINFGSELQSMSPDERIRRRAASLHSAQDGTSSTGGGSSSEAASDFRAVLTAQSAYEADGNRERRGSGASASTTTARSFQQLHRKYSSAQAAARSASSTGALAVPSDTDSERAVSVSEGRHTPLPPILGDSESGAEESPAGTPSQKDKDRENTIPNGAAADRDDASSAERGPTPREQQFFTPEPPPSPVVENAAVNEQEDDESEHSVKGGEQFPSPPLQPVSA